MINDIIKYKYHYDNSFKILRKIFNNLSHDDFYDMFTDSILVGYENFQNTFDPNRNVSELSYLVFILRRKMLTQIRKENARKIRFFSHDFQEGAEDDTIYKEIQGTIENLQINQDVTPTFLQDYLFRDKMDRGLISAYAIKEHSVEDILAKNNLNCLKRKVWTSENLINEENYKTIARNNFSGLDSPQHYNFSDPMPVIKIKCWIACSKVE